MGVYCPICKSSNCEGSEELCYRIVNKLLMAKGLPEDISFPMAQTWRYEMEEMFPPNLEEEVINPCKKCGKEMEQPDEKSIKSGKKYHWCWDCATEYFKKQREQKNKPVICCLIDSDDED